MKVYPLQCGFVVGEEAPAQGAPSAHGAGMQLHRLPGSLFQYQIFSTPLSHFGLGKAAK